MDVYAKDKISIVKAGEEDVGEISSMLRELAEYEGLLDQLEADEDSIREALFGPYSKSEAVMLKYDGVVAGYCAYFHNFPTFSGRQGVFFGRYLCPPRISRKRFGPLGV